MFHQPGLTRNVLHYVVEFNGSPADNFQKWKENFIYISSIKTLETTGNSIFCATETLANWKTLELNPWNIALWQPSVGPCRGIIRGGDIPVLGHDVLLVITLLILSICLIICLCQNKVSSTLLFTGNLNLMRNMNTQAKTFIMVNTVIFRRALFYIIIP